MIDGIIGKLNRFKRIYADAYQHPQNICRETAPRSGREKVQFGTDFVRTQYNLHTKMICKMSLPPMVSVYRTAHLRH